MERQRIGATAEDLAVEFLRSRGLQVLLRNVRWRAGELDIVARDRTTLILVEVRSRSSNRFGGAAASVDFRKRMKLRRAAALLLQDHKELASLPVRFDVVVVHGPLTGDPQVEWLQHAFT